MTRDPLNRFQWLKVVLQSGAVSMTAKAIASALAVQYANDLTGKINPSALTPDTHPAETRADV